MFLKLLFTIRVFEKMKNKIAKSLFLKIKVDYINIEIKFKRIYTAMSVRIIEILLNAELIFLNSEI